MIKGVIRNTAVQTLGKVVMVLVSLVTTGILTRRLGVNGYGAFTLTTSIFLLIDSLADMGTRMIGVREAAKCENWKSKKKVLVNVFILRKILALAAFVLGLGLVAWYPGFEGFRWWALVALGMSLMTSLAGDEEIVFQTEARLDLKTIMDVLYPIGFLVMAIFLGDNLSLGWAFLGYLISRIISIGVGWKLMLVKIKKIDFGDWRDVVETKLWWKLLKQSWPMGVYMLVFIGYDRAADSMMIRAFWDETYVASYGLAYKMYSNLITPAYFLASAVFPIMAKNQEKNVTRKSLFVAGLMILSIVPIVYFLAPWMVQILAGSDFDMAATVLRILLGALVFSYINHIVGFRLISKEGQKELLWLGVSALVINISLNWIFIPKYGIISAAWVTVWTEAVMLLMTLISLRKKN